MQLETPVLFLIFNRPDNTSEVFESIKQARPKKLFVAADGPRDGKQGEFENCQQAKTIATSVDWNCEVRTLFREKNLGCKLAVSSGINWFFEHVENGIILEDDCNPNLSFFGFCQQMLSYYDNDARIMMICGTNYLPVEISAKITNSYFFSNYYPIWGWATWKRAWRLYDVKMKGWDEFKETHQLSWLFSSYKIAAYYQSMFELIRNGFDTWDIQWWFTCISQSGLSVIPKYNLVSNIGITGTHSNTQGDFFINTPTYHLELTNMIHPQFVVSDKYLNEVTYKLSHAQIDVGSSITSPSVSLSFRTIIKLLLKKLVRK